MYPKHGVSLKSRKRKYTFSQSATAERVTNANEGPIGKTTLGARFRNLSGDERQMRWKLVSRVPDSIGEIVGQKVDHIPAVVRPFICVRRKWALGKTDRVGGSAHRMR